jgi:hypothetical protein
VNLSDLRGEVVSLTKLIVAMSQSPKFLKHYESLPPDRSFRQGALAELTILHLLQARGLSPEFNYLQPRVGWYDLRCAGQYIEVKSCQMHSKGYRPYDARTARKLGGSQGQLDAIIVVKTDWTPEADQANFVPWLVLNPASFAPAV